VVRVDWIAPQHPGKPRFLGERNSAKMGACREASTAEGEVYTTAVLGIRWRRKSLYLYVDVEGHFREPNVSIPQIAKDMHLGID